MTGKDRRLAMAYALGLLEGTRRRVALGSINSEWKDFDLTISVHDNTNNTYALYYDHPFGCEDAFVRVLTLHEGWEFDHMVHLLMQAIDCIKAENKETA